MKLKLIVKKIFLFILHRTYFLFPETTYIKLKYFIKRNKFLNLKRPKLFGEKLQWLKLYYRKPFFTDLVDKIKVKEIVASIIGKEYIIPTLGVYNNPDDIDFEKLPDRFVIKCNHNSGKGMYVCRDKSKIDITKIKKNLQKGLKEDYYSTSKEWPYKDVERKILIEKFLENGVDQDLPDFKFFCFDGIPKYCQVIKNRSTDETIDFFDMDWNHQPFIGLSDNIKHCKNEIPKPYSFEKMKEIVTILSNGLKFVRIDLYEIKGKIYFGEITFFPASGFGEFRPKKWNEKIGDMIKI